ncbi:RsmF rRNA methyltransferase first C-terminal domain-containing protein [Bacillus sp. FJAT-47783]|uniref:RsmF rRNA methyltransferase first C-terminal domain-containing protein n=1 Tax=Bacillus sp. FJAT-47783 TaxID=2922712 RepID=UPI00325F9C84
MLPKEFTNKMNMLLKEEANEFFKSYEQPKSSALRLNVLKLSTKQFEDNSPFHTSKIPFCDTGYYFHADKDEPGKHPYHFTGAYYIQEPSAMLPAELLNPNPTDRVLDLCAAPGGKSTQLAVKMNNSGVLVSNEIHPKRAKILAENIERLGIRNTVVTNEAPERLASHFQQYFDKILVDAPCSGEGMFRKDPEATKFWSTEHVEKCAITQKEILRNAYNMLKPGGVLVYSTCTFSPEENEQVMEWFITEFPDMKLQAIPKEYGMADGRINWTLHNTEAVQNSVRLWPHLLKGEGHFVAKLIKANDESEHSIVKLEKNIVKERDLNEFRSFEKHYLKKKITGDFMIHKDHLFLLPDNCPHFGNLKVIRKGLHIGYYKKKRFEPSHHLAHYLSQEDVKHTYNMKSHEKEWKAYLRGETIPTGGDSGWTLVLIDGMPIGWGKETKGTLKNFYPKGLRIYFK